MKRMLCMLGFGLILLQPLWAEVVILDSSDIQDWVRVVEQNYPKYKDTLIRPTALLKFRTVDLPKGAKIEYASLRIRALKCAYGAVITASYVSDDSWSFDTTDAGDLYQWPVEYSVGYYNSG